jgi:hypothetical protein
MQVGVCSQYKSAVVSVQDEGGERLYLFLRTPPGLTQRGSQDVSAVSLFCNERYRHLRVLAVRRMNDLGYPFNIRAHPDILAAANKYAIERGKKEWGRKG